MAQAFASQLDEDVAREQRMVENIDDFDEYGLVVKGLSKVGLSCLCLSNA